MCFTQLAIPSSCQSDEEDTQCLRLPDSVPPTDPPGSDGAGHDNAEITITQSDEKDEPLPKKKRTPPGRAYLRQTMLLSVGLLAVELRKPRKILTEKLWRKRDARCISLPLRLSGLKQHPVNRSGHRSPCVEEGRQAYIERCNIWYL